MGESPFGWNSFFFGLCRPKLFVHLGINCNLKYHEKNFMGPFGLLVGDGRGNGKRYR